MFGVDFFNTLRATLKFLHNAAADDNDNLAITIAGHFQMLRTGRHRPKL